MVRPITARFALPVFVSAAALAFAVIQRPVLGAASSLNPIGNISAANPLSSEGHPASWNSVGRLFGNAAASAPSASQTTNQTMPVCIIAPSTMASSFGKVASSAFLTTSAASVNSINPSGAAYAAFLPTSYQVEIDVSEIATGGGYVQVGCDQPSIVHSPSSSWPYNLSFPSNGPTAQSFNVTVSSVTTSQTVHLYACEEGGDISDPDDWRVIATITVTPH